MSVSSTKLKKTRSKRAPLIAILDADAAVLNYLQRILADRFRVNVFTEAAELIQSLSKPPAPDLLLMDWHIGGEGALRLLAKIHVGKPQLPIVMLSCSAELKEVVAATRMGAADVLLKPFRKADIDLILRECLKGADKQQDEDEEEVSEIPLD
jgi:two-component system response regulator AtoC